MKDEWGCRMKNSEVKFRMENEGERLSHKPWFMVY